jgi:hypothetical protein
MVRSQIEYKNFVKGSKNTLEGKEMEAEIVDKIEIEGTTHYLVQNNKKELIIILPNQLTKIVNIKNVNT